MTGWRSPRRNPRREIIEDPKAASWHFPAGRRKRWASRRVLPAPGGPMDPSSATKATLKVLALCFALLLLAAAVTVSVALLVRHAEAARRLEGCRERAANETAALASRVAELERERAEQAKQLEKLAQREKDLQRQLGQAKDSRKRLSTALTGCLENVTRLDANLSALQNEMFTLQAEGTDINSRNGALLVEMAQWKDQVAGLEGQLAEAVDARAAAKAEKEACKARQEALQESLQSYLAEIASLQRRLQARATSSAASSRRRCPPSRYLFWGLVTLCALVPLEGLSFLR